jgi:hypothetical protein
MRSKTRNTMCRVLSGLLALGFAGGGISMLLGAADQLHNLQSWGYPLWLRFPIGVGELVLAAGLLLTRFRTRTLYGVLGWAVVAIITHLQAGQAAMLAGPAIFTVLALLDLQLWNKATRNPAYFPDLSWR